MLQAHTVLDDCRRAHAMLEEETDSQRLRVLWVAGVALARAVGHVLHKVDGQADPQVREAVAREYRRWSDERAAHQIFWDFIEQERNQVLKRYEVGYDEEGFGVMFDGELFFAPECIYIPVADGPFAGEDGRDVLLQAIEWWDDRLRAIESDARERGHA